MSVEQASGMRSDELDGRSDIYSLGIVTYEMIAGRVPFQADTPMGYLKRHLIEPPPPLRQSRPDLRLSPQLDEVVMKALKKERDERYSTAPDFAREFSLAVSTPTETWRPPAAPPPRATEKARVEIVPQRKFPAKYMVAGTAVLLAAVVLGGWYALSTKAPPKPPVQDHRMVAVPVSEPQKQAPSGIAQQRQSEPAQNPATLVVQRPNHNRAAPPPGHSVAWLIGAMKGTARQKQETPAPTQVERAAPAQTNPDAERKTKAAIALGDPHYNRGEYDEAIAEYKRGLEADPSNAVLRIKIDRAEKAKAAEQRLNQ
jgi:hypothetical protein